MIRRRVNDHILFGATTFHPLEIAATDPGLGKSTNIYRDGVVLKKATHFTWICLLPRPGLVFG